MASLGVGVTRLVTLVVVSALGVGVTRLLTLVVVSALGVGVIGNTHKPNLKSHVH